MCRLTLIKRRQLVLCICILWSRVWVLYSASLTHHFAAGGIINLERAMSAKLSLDGGLFTELLRANLTTDNRY